MTWKCCVWNCKSSLSTRGMRFFRFPIPSDGLTGIKTKRFEAWRTALGYSNGFVPSNKRVCSLHFVTGNPARLTDVTNRDWIPSINLRKKSLDDRDSMNFRRHQKNERRKRSSESSNSNRSSGRGRQQRKTYHRSSLGSQTSFSSESNSRSDDSLKAQSGTSKHSSKSSVSRDLRRSECQRDSSSGSSSAASIQSSSSSTSSRKSRAASSSSDSSSQSDNSRKSQLSSGASNCTSERSGRRRERTSSTTTTSDIEDGNAIKDDAPFSDKNSSSETDCNDQKELNILRKKVIHLTEIAKMNERGFYFISVTNAKCLYYTGITNFPTVRRIYEYLEGNLSKPHCNFSKEQVFVMTLTKLRLNPQFQTLAYEYNVSLNTISKYFHRTLDIIDRCLSYALEVPTKDVLLKHTPKKFKDQFGDARIFIVDCFEIRSETPEQPKAAVSHFSNYKKSETTKFLIAICPDGNISFISPGYGGRCSDKKIFKDSGFLDILQPGDIVLADKGFDVDDLVRSRGATLNIPTFLKQKQQFKPAEIERNKQITRLRIHIERCIGVLKMKFLVMAHIITVDSMVRFENNKNIVDLVARVCCILYNFNPSIIPE